MEDKKEVTQEEKKEVATKNEHVNMVADFENGIYGSSDSFKMAYQMAKALSQSTIVPAHFQRNEANCLVAISQAQKMGIDPFTVMQNMYMIQGNRCGRSTLGAFRLFIFMCLTLPCDSARCVRLSCANHV